MLSYILTARCDHCGCEIDQVTAPNHALLNLQISEWRKEWREAGMEINRFKHNKVLCLECTRVHRNNS